MIFIWLYYRQWDLFARYRKQTKSLFISEKKGVEDDILEILLLVVGFVLLVKGADAFVDGCSNVAKALGIPSLIIGLTIVAFGTSAPELAVSLIASFKGNSAISVGNVVGSNICNMLLVLGATSLFATLNCKRKLVTRDFVYLFLSYVALFIISVGTYIESGKVGTINRVNGLLLVCFLGIYIYSLLGDAKGNMKKEENSREKWLSRKYYLLL